MAILQPLIDIAAVCYGHGIRHVVLSPGSRSAALTLAFSRHGGFEMHAVMDERSAGFIALGMAQQLGIPVVLLCTSGSAAYNLAPAVSEAFFQQIPLLVLTADRPKEWIHQYDGQTIYQYELYGKHVKRFFELSSDYDNKDVIWSINRILNDAINIAGTIPPGPVHINVPIREPFYPTADENLLPSDNVRIVKRTPVEVLISTEVWHELLNEWDDVSRILIVGGQHFKSERLNKVLTKISQELDVPVIGDSISNLSGSELFIHHQDLFLAGKNDQNLVPELLITYGLSLMSKELKTFLRNNQAVRHWHVGQDTIWTDPLQSTTRLIGVSPTYFFENLFEKIDYQLFVQSSDPENDSEYLTKWLSLEQRSARLIENHVNNLTLLTDLTVINFVLNQLNDKHQLHIGNSMPIRYVNALGKSNDFSEIFCNRGTSGIDGCVSTAIGAAMVNRTATFLIVGDVAFLYDRNGLLINQLPQNLKIIIINNGGGNIFRMIDGPANLPELENYFETRHEFTAQKTAEDSNIPYTRITDMTSMDSDFENFLKIKGIGILEIFSDAVENALVWRNLKQFMRSGL